MINTFAAFLGMGIVGTGIAVLYYIAYKSEKQPKKKQSVIIRPDTHKPFTY